MSSWRIRARLEPLALVALLAAGTTACSGELAGGPTRPVASVPDDPFADVCDVQAIFGAYACTTCHDATPGITGGNLDLLSPGLAGRLVNRPSNSPSCAQDLLVDGETPEASVLLRAVAPERYAGHGSDSCTPRQMPFEQSRTVTDEHVACLEEWVRAASVDAPPVAEPAPFDPASVLSAIAKAKYLAQGGAITDEEIAAATNDDGALDPEGLRTLIDGWMFAEPGQLTPGFDRKVRAFLELSLQQRRLAGTATFTFQSQINLRPKIDGWIMDRNRLVDGISRSFLDTSRDIVEEDRDFRAAITTRRWYVTTAHLAALVHADLLELRRTGAGRTQHAERFVQFMHLTDEDYSDWRYVTLEQATAENPPDFVYENTAELAAGLRAIGDEGALRLWVPRVGFFSTIVFLDTWESNPDNQFRVTASQALIGALDLIFEAGDGTTPATLDGLDADHADEGSACYGCHARLDPLRTAFSAYYGFSGRGLGPREGGPSTFAFHGHVVPELRTMDEFAEALVSHPRFATAWTQKACMWANSQRCVESDPEFQRVAERFRLGYDEDSPADDFRLSTLFRELLSSTLVTGTTPSLAHEQREFIVSATRFHHFCQATRERLEQGAALRCAEQGLDPSECRSPHSPGCLSGWSRAQALGVDDASRGVREFVTPSTQDPMYAVAVREACRDIASEATDGSGAYPRNDDPEPTIRRMVETTMGLPPSHPRHGLAYAALLRTHRILREGEPCPDGQSPLAANEGIGVDGELVCGAGLNRTEAMQNVFMIACSSPDLVGLGL